MGSLEEHVDNDVSGQGITQDEIVVGRRYRFINSGIVFTAGSVGSKFLTMRYPGGHSERKPLWKINQWLACGSLVEDADATEEELIELRWSGAFRVIPEPVVEPEMPDWMKAESDRLWYGPKFDRAYYGR